MDEPLVLLNPGPVNVSERVRRAFAECPDQCHREPEYLAMQERVRRLLREAFALDASWSPVLLTGSGTAAMEAMVASVVGTGVLVVENGVYGDRLARIAQAHEIPCGRVRTSWFERPDPEAVRAALRDEHDTIALVHHETTTGLCNDVAALARVARATGRRLIVDSVSGLGGEPLDLREDAPDAVCCTANKCVQGLPGVAFVLLREGVPLRRRSLYLDLESLRAHQDRGDTPFTPAIQTTAAFEAALEELVEETVPGRIARYGRAAEAIRSAMREAGLELLLPEPLRSHTITTARLPEGVTYERVHDRMREDGFVVYGGQGDLRRTAFRVANMGALPDGALERFPAALRRALR